ncbi:MAG: adenylyl-sulfate kinase, partial [Candidatus Margulisbacteria bacterium]|nr:adenylyl-sulfate kinase [Candidatus Margulisiibacteriota bacterium]
MKRKNLFICFTGIDGSGKSTLANMTVEMLAREGISCEYVYCRFTHFLSKPFSEAGRKLFLAKENMFL